MDATNDTPIATDIYERLEMNKAGEGGSVHSDLEEAILDGNYQEFEDYFQDLDPFEFL
jgi:hypothetical protein